MKYMESCRQTLVELKNADEIKINYKDIDRIRDFISEDWTCEADIIVYIYNNDQDNVDWNMLKSYQEVLNIIIAIENINYHKIVQENEFKWFWMYPIPTFWELNSILDLNACQILIDAPIFFELPTVFQLTQGKAELRVVANQCYNNYLPRKQTNGVYGVYIRPEDILLYSQYIQHIEFETSSLKEERAYIRIYKYQQTWPGNLNLLIPKYGIDVDNRGFDSDFANRRLNCKQKCQSNGRCDYCRLQPDLINTIQKNADWIMKQLN